MALVWLAGTLEGVLFQMTESSECVHVEYIQRVLVRTGREA